MDSRCSSFIQACRLASIQAIRMADMKKHCATCGGKFGLLRHRWFGYAFCKRKCKSDFLAKRQREIERVRRWLGYLSRSPT